MAGRRTALIVANDRYDNDGLSRLQSPVADAEALGRVLGDPRIGGFDVAVVHNEPAHVVATRVEDFFTDGRPDDVLLLHFSCHGLKSESGELYFAASATRPDRLGSTAVSADFVQRCMRTSRSRSIVLLLDCCYGGAFSRGVAVRAAGDVDVLDTFRGGGRGRAVITASSSMEYAFEGDRLADDHTPAPSVFTAALVDGLETGDADRDEDGWVSLNELYDYVYDRVRERNANQTPSRDVEMQGELYLARSQRRRIRPQPIPPDLRAAMTDANVFSRMGAVAELRSRLANPDAGVAAGAAEALREVAAADISYVADAARAALADAETPAVPDVVEPETDAPAQPVPPAPAAPAARRPIDLRAGPYVAVGAGVLALLCGLVVLYAEETDVKVYAAEAHLVVFAAYWLWQAIERPGVRRLAPVLLVVWTAVNLAWMISANWYYMEEYALDGRPLTVFWLVAGLLATAGSIGRPAGAPDLLIGGTAMAYGLVVLAVTGATSDTAFAVSWASFVLVTGVIWLIAGLEGFRRLPDRVHQNA